MMKKLLLAIPLVAGASWAGASYYTGTQTQTAYDQLLVQMNEWKPFTLINENYSAGMTNSTAITKVMDSTGPDAKLLFRLHHDITHTPIGMGNDGVRVGAATIKTTLVRDNSLPDHLREFMASFDDDEPVQILTDVAFDGATVNRFLVSPYQHDYDGLKVKFDGVDYTADVDGDIFAGSGTIGQLLLSSDDGEVRLTGGDVTTDLQRISQAVYTGSYGIEFDKLSVSSADMPFDVALQSIAITSDTTLSDQDLESRLGFSIANIDSPMPVNSVSLNAGVKGLALGGLEEAMEKLNAISLVDQMAGTDPEVIAALLEAYSSMVSAGSGINYGLKVGNDDGEAEASIAVSVVEESSPNFPAGGLDSVETLRDLLNVLKMEAHMLADAEFVDRSPLAMFMMGREAEQFILADGSTYKSDITVSNLVADINGNPMALEFMIGEMLDMPISALMEM